MPSFIIFPAIDLRGGHVVRLQEGDPTRQTSYSSDPEWVAEEWLRAGARWLHVVNLDGAFGEPDAINQKALESILKVAKRSGVKVQLGGGLRSIKSIKATFDLGVDRVILGTFAMEYPDLLPELIANYGPDRIGVSLDARKGLIHIHGWKSSTSIQVVDKAVELQNIGLHWLIYTDISRDGLQKGLNLPATIALKKATSLEIIASGGVQSWEDIHLAFQANLAGVIIGKALYEGFFNFTELFRFPEATHVS